MYVWNDRERERAIQKNYRKANYLEYEKEYKKPGQYENGQKQYDNDLPKTKSELDHVIFGAVMSAQNQLLHILIPRLEKITDELKTFKDRK